MSCLTGGSRLASLSSFLEAEHCLDLLERPVHQKAGQASLALHLISPSNVSIQVLRGEASVICNTHPMVFSPLLDLDRFSRVSELLVCFDQASSKNDM